MLSDRSYRGETRCESSFDRTLPGNPNSAFLKGISLEAMQDREGAAQEYQRYLKQVKSGDQAKHAASRLKAWGLRSKPPS